MSYQLLYPFVVGVCTYHELLETLFLMVTVNLITGRRVWGKDVGKYLSTRDLPSEKVSDSLYFVKDYFE